MDSKEKARLLLEQMTLREKIGQLNQRLYGFSIYERKGEEIILTGEFQDEVERWGGLGVLYGLYRADPWSKRTKETGITCDISAKAYNAVQKYVIEHSRLHIPMLLSTECPHGHQALGGGLLPVNTACGATFDTKLIREAYTAVGQQLKAGHVNLALMSVLDVLRDPRWGRSEECYSEDPVLCAKLAAAAISGMQEAGVAAVAKHLCAQGETTGGVNASAASIGERELRDIHLRGMKACAEIGVKGVMAAYNEIDGVYCHANPWLLKDVLRKEYGFEGIVMADGFAVDAMKNVTGDLSAAGALALSSGVDVSLWDNGFTLLEDALNKNLLKEQDIDAAVLRVLELKYECGLFEHPYMEENMCEEETYGIDKLSGQIANESVVLLKNNDILPLKGEYKKIAVIGPNANSVYAMLGDYTPPRDEEKAVTILQGLHSAFPDSRIIYQEDDAKLEHFDLAIVVGGGSSSRYLEASFEKNGAAIAENKKKKESMEYMECGEGMDVASLNLPGHMIKRVRALKKKAPVIFIAVAGRPYALGKVEKYCDAVLYSFYPGPFGGRAIADILSGKIAPTGRLPVSIPRSTGQIPCYYNYKESYQGMHYCNEKQGALYSFGEGLTYGKLKYEGYELKMEANYHVTLDFCVTNMSEYHSAAIPQLYIHRIGGGVTSRVRELRNFERISLKPLEEKKVCLCLNRDDFIFYDEKMQPSTNAIRYEIILMDQGLELFKGEIS